MLNLEVRTSTVGHVSDKQRLSDHVPVLSFICAKKQYGQGSIPVWVTRDPFYAKALDHEIGQYKLETLSPAEGLQQLKRCMRSACKQVTRKALRRGAVTIEEQIYWSLVCARALFHGLAWRVVQAILAYPKLEEFILVNCVSGTMQISDSDGLNQHISSLMRESIERLRSDIEETIGLPEYEREQQRTSLSRVMEWWSTRCRKISLQTARDEKGDVITDPDHAAAVFTAYWKRVAEEKTIDSKKAKEFLKQHVRKLPKFTCVLKLDEFVEIVRELPDSACGPDGVPYSAWKHASKDALKVLYRVYCSLFTEAQVAEDFNHSWLVLLAKGGHAEDDHIVARAAEDTRPVSLANSDSKICEIALNKPLANAMKQWACPEQRGFVEGRMIVDNVLEIDTYGRICSIAASSNGKDTRSACPGDVSRLPAMLFSDFAAAFPSVAWGYLWMCMRFSGVPRCYIRAFKKVYYNNLHLLRFMGKVYEAYVNASGVKTGGPASGTIFVLCIDPFLRMLQAQRGPRDIGRSFADDIGYVIFDIKITLPKFVICFRLFGEVSTK